METGAKLNTKFVENFLNGCPFSSLDLSYEKPEVVKKNICNNFNIKAINCSTKCEAGNEHTNGYTNGHLNGHANGYANNHASVTNKDNQNSEDKLPLNYGDYLMLDKLLSCQEPITRTSKKEEAHDEHLFIVTHQSYEIWFKQILWELNSVQKLILKKLDCKSRQNFTGDYVYTISYRLHRVYVILKHLVNQWEILDTMTPVDFVEFRAYLKPASGFQSYQFRLVENKLGVRKDSRVNYGKCNYIKVFHDVNKVNNIKNSENEPSLYDLIEKWLEKQSTDDFIKTYSKGVSRMLEDLEAEINGQTHSEAMKQILINDYLKKKQLFDQLTNEKRYKELVERGDRRLSFRAFRSALCVFVNKDFSDFSMMFQILKILQDIDTELNKWRTNHVNIVLKMIGSDLNGTGGSSGYQYLKATLTDRYKVFTDFFNMSSYLIERKYISDYD